MNLNLNFLLAVTCTFIELSTAGPYVAPPIQIKPVKNVIEWQQLEFGFPSPKHKEQALANGDLVVENATPIDVQPHYGGRNRFRLFMTVPRFTTGVPYTLATVAEELGPKGPYIYAYPNYDWHNRQDKNCEKITSVFRVAINECNQMWVLDSGVIGTTQICPPQLLLFDLNTDQLLRRFRFPATLYTPSASLFITPLSIVQDPAPQGSCQQAKVYMADVNRHGLVVYDQATNAAWRIENRFMYPDPEFGTHTIAGESFTLMDGIFALASDKRYLYFHPLASNNEYSISLQLLNNRTIWSANMEALPQAFTKLGKRRSQCGAEAMDSRGYIYCVTFNPIRLIAWNTNTPYKPKNFLTIPANENNLEFVSGMKVIITPDGKEQLWMLSNRYQKIAASTMNRNEVNFRILKRSLTDVHQSSMSNGIILNGLQNVLIFT